MSDDPMDGFLLRQQQEKEEQIRFLQEMRRIETEGLKRISDIRRNGIKKKR